LKITVNVFYSTFTNVFLFLARFYVFIVFLFFGERLFIYDFIHLSLSSVNLIDSSTESPVNDLMLSIQAVRGLPRLRAPGIVRCIISFPRRFPCFVMVCP